MPEHLRDPSRILADSQGVLSKVQFSFDPTKDKAPKVQGTVLGKPTAAQLKDLHLRPKENGSCVRFLLHDDCRIPEDGTIVPSSRSSTCFASSTLTRT